MTRRSLLDGSVMACGLWVATVLAVAAALVVVVLLRRVTEPEPWFEPEDGVDPWRDPYPDGLVG